MSDLTSRLNQWLEFHDEMGTPLRAGLGPGLTGRQIDRVEEALGHDLLPDLRELMAWHTPSRDGSELLPLPFGNWLQSNYVISGSRLFPDVIEVLELPEGELPCRPATMVQLFDGFSAIDHGGCSTNGGVYNWDVGGEGWYAPSFSALLDVFLEYAERGWFDLVYEEALDVNAAAVEAVAQQEASYLEANPDVEGPLYLSSELYSFRLAAVDDPTLSVRGHKHWIW